MLQISEEKKKTPQIFRPLGRVLRVLVAGEDKGVQAVLTSALSSMGFDVYQAGDGIEALTYCMEHSFDLVLIDLDMPLRDGPLVAHFVKERSPETPVILLIDADKTSDLNKVERGSFDWTMSKPLKPDQFKQIVQCVLEKRPS
jgi:CheY-like chemotaxis protein